MWHEVYTTLPTGETQSYSYGYVLIFWTLTLLFLTSVMHALHINVHMAASNLSLYCFFSLYWQVLIVHVSVRSFIRTCIAIFAAILCIWNDMMTMQKCQNRQMVCRFIQLFCLKLPISRLTGHLISVQLIIYENFYTIYEVPVTRCILACRHIQDVQFKFKSSNSQSDEVCQLRLIYWDFHAQPSLRFIGNGQRRMFSWVFSL